MNVKEPQMSTEPAYALDDPNAGEAPDSVIKHVSFCVGDETYAVVASKVHEVLRVSEITPVPGAPRFILGIINLRGNVVTVMDARHTFDLPSAEVTPQSRIIVVEVEDFSLGILVDRVAAVVDLDEKTIETAPQTGQEAGSLFIQGVYNDEEQMLILVDFSRVMDMIPNG